MGTHKERKHINGVNWCIRQLIEEKALIESSSSNDMRSRLEIKLESASQKDHNLVERTMNGYKNRPKITVIAESWAELSKRF